MILTSVMLKLKKKKENKEIEISDNHLRAIRLTRRSVI